MTNIIDKADNLIALSEAATPGPWAHDPVENCGPVADWGVWQLESGGPIAYVGDPYPRGDNNPIENMQFIVAARNDGPEIAAALKVAVETLRLVRNELDELQQHAINLIDNALRELGIEVGE